MVEYKTAFHTYLRLKSGYEKKLNSKKSKIINDGALSKKEKQRRVASIQMKCLGCERKVGTIFKTQDREYIAMCGDTMNPCEFKIILQKPQVLDLKRFIQMTKNDLQQTIADIIKTKLSLVFGFITDEELDENFNSLRETYEGDLEQLRLLENNIEYATNSEKRKENKVQLGIEIYIGIKQIKDQMKEFIETENSALLEDVMEKYEELLENIELLRENTYRVMMVEIEDNGREPTIVNLIQKANSQKAFEFEINPGEVIEFNT